MLPFYFSIKNAMIYISKNVYMNSICKMFMWTVFIKFLWVYVYVYVWKYYVLDGVIVLFMYVYGITRAICNNVYLNFRCKKVFFWLRYVNMFRIYFTDLFNI